MNEEEFYNKRLLNNDNYTVFLPEHPWIKRAQVNNEGFNNGKLMETLQEEYPHLYKSIQDEKHFIPEDERYFYLFEIPDETEETTIGFATFTIYDEKSLIMNQIYVLPEYRGNKHFIATYNFFAQLLEEAEIYIKNPSRTIIDNIKEANYCTIIKDRFLLSNILFIFDQVAFEDTLKHTNKSYHGQGKKAKYFTETNLYDLEIDALIKTSQNNKIYTGQEDLLKVERSTISLVRDEDEKRFNVLAKRKEDPWIKNGNYFKKLVKTLRKEKITNI